LERPRPAISRALAFATKCDSWGGRISREEQFVQKLRSAGVPIEIDEIEHLMAESGFSDRAPAVG